MPNRALAAFFLLLLAGFQPGCESTDRATRRAERESREAEERRLRSEFLTRIHAAETEVWRALDPLMRAAAGYRDEETHGYLGAAFVTEDFYSEALWDATEREGLGGHVTALAVFPDSPAEEAGLQAGDRIVSVNGAKVPKGPRATTFAVKKFKRLLRPEEENLLEVQRGAETLALAVEPGRGAYYAVVVVASREMDLYADGHAIWIGLDLAETLGGTDKLGYVCAYALAQNVMRHSKQRGRNAFLGQMVDLAAAVGGIPTGGLFGGMGASAHEAAYEIESDLIALYLLASSGHDIAGYPDFWEPALAARSRKGTLRAMDLERLNSMKKIIAAIEKRRELGQEIYPEGYLTGDAAELE